MRADNEAAGYPFTPLGWWEKVGGQFEDWFENEGLGDITMQSYNRHFAALGGQSSLSRHIEHLGGNLDGYQEQERYAISLLRDAILKRYNRAVWSYGGNNAMEWDILTAQEALFAIAERSPEILEQPVTVGDLGAGWGRIGFALMRLNPRAQYIVYDIPNSLIVSYTYLHRLIGTQCNDYRVRPYGPGVFFLGSQELLDSHPLDYLITIATTQEMEPGHAMDYMNIIENKTKWFYTLQRRQTGLHYKDEWKCHFNRSPLWADYHFEALFDFNG